MSWVVEESRCRRSRESRDVAVFIGVVRMEIKREARSTSVSDIE